MEPILVQGIQRSLLHYGSTIGRRSPIWADLCAALGAGPAPAVLHLFARYFQIMAATAPDVPILLAALHHLALTGDAKTFSHYLPTCEGGYQQSDAQAMAAAAEATLDIEIDTVLDFMLSQSPRIPSIRCSGALQLGLCAIRERFGSGVTLIEIGSCGNQHLALDRLPLEASLAGEIKTAERLLSLGLPPVVARYGFDSSPLDLTDPVQRLILEAFLSPEDTADQSLLRHVAELLQQCEHVDLRGGPLEDTLPGLLVDAYSATPRGNCLVLMNAWTWVGLTDAERRFVASAIQQLAAHLEPEKPLAWLQLEPSLTNHGRLELRLNTFGWADPEDRAVRKLADVDPLGNRITWLER